MGLSCNAASAPLMDDAASSSLYNAGIVADATVALPPKLSSLAADRKLDSNQSHH